MSLWTWGDTSCSFCSVSSNRYTDILVAMDRRCHYETLLWVGVTIGPWTLLLWTDMSLWTVGIAMGVNFRLMGSRCRFMCHYGTLNLLLWIDISTENWLSLRIVGVALGPCSDVHKLLVRFAMEKN